MTAFGSFVFAPCSRRRHQTVSDVMPINPGLRYAVVLSDAYLHTEGNDRRVSGLADLREALGVASATEALQAARARGQLTEGSRGLPWAVREYLMSIGQDRTFVRGWTLGSATPSLCSYPTIQFWEVLRRFNFEEVEACDSSEVWYLRFRDDDPLVFLSMQTDFLRELIQLSPDTCIEVEPGFVYAE